MPGQKSSLLINLDHIINYLYSALTQKGFEVANKKKNRNSCSSWVSSVCQTLPVGCDAYIACNFTEIPPGANHYGDNRYRGWEPRQNYMASFLAHYGWAVRCWQITLPGLVNLSFNLNHLSSSCTKHFTRARLLLLYKAMMSSRYTCYSSKAYTTLTTIAIIISFLILSVDTWRHEVQVATGRTSQLSV